VSVANYLAASGAKPRIGFAARFSDLALVAAVVSIIGLMILPLPVMIIDLLVAINMVTGVLLLLSTLYIRTPLELSAFPAILLVTTLFRLALSIATTRMILLNAEAGHIITTFGEMVVGGNLVVGLVVFLIITVVQFIVIAKGAERVAEVAARFSLDAMPGKQMSIDSDLRSGLLDKDEARAKRGRLEGESKLHGSLDGAMKFVKGDAMASIIIVIINLIGGLTIGVLQRDMSFSVAMHSYSVLTIGEGLVAQIPALLAAMAAGLIVTRAADDERGTNLGETIRQQLTRNPRVLMIAGGIALMMGFIPGFPTIVFMALAGAALVGGASLHPRLGKHVTKAMGSARPVRVAEPMPSALTASPRELKPVVPLLLLVDQPGLGADGARALGDALAQMLDQLQYRVGLPLPRIDLHFEAGVGEPRWRLLAFEVPIGGGTITDPATLPADVAAVLRRNLRLFLGVQEVTNLLNRLGTEYPEVVKEAVRAVATSKIAEVMRLLVAEEVPLRNMRDALEALAEAGAQERDSNRIADLTRIALGRYLTQAYAPEGTLRALIASPEMEDVIRAGVRRIDGVDRLAIEPARAREIIDAIAAAARASEARVIVTTFDVRRPLRRLIEAELFDLPVLAYNELSPTVKLDVAGQLQPPEAQMDALVPNYAMAAE